MKRYAQTDENKICFATANLTDNIVAPDDWILIKSHDDVLGKLYINGEWEEVPLPEPEPSPFSVIQEQNIVIMEAIADQYEQSLNDRLNDMEVQATIYEAVLALGEGGAAV